MTEEIITNGTSAFTGIVDKLGDITTEFVPYLIYIAIAILGIALTIKAVKRLLEIEKIRSINTFKRQEMRERRTRRRRNRRFTKSVRKNDTAFKFAYGKN